MSGGVDSSVAAALLQRAGYDVIGCFMRLGTVGEGLEDSTGKACDTAAQCTTGASPPPTQASAAKIHHKGCCSVGDAADARTVAAMLGIPFYVCNFKKDFGRIIDYFVDEYASGRTPNPCVRCNDWLKFGKLHDYARTLGCDYVASGHYARVRDGRLLRAVDARKDQSYVLFGVPRDRLAHMLLPIGELTKPRVRQLAREFDLPVFDKPDSQEICFVPDDDYASLVDRRRPHAARDGEIVDEAGRTLGRHGGQHRFTIGQRRGLGVSGTVPLFVLNRDPHSNRVTVGLRESLACSGTLCAEANWLMDEPAAGEWIACQAKFRSNSVPVEARVRAITPLEAPTPSGRTGAFEVRFNQPQEGVAPGQALVLYQGECVIGGGWIARTLGAISEPHPATM